nr:hypothetical transcript [Hymenolepis microstoma]
MQIITEKKRIFIRQRKRHCTTRNPQQNQISHHQTLQLLWKTRLIKLASIRMLAMDSLSTQRNYQHTLFA